MKGRAYSRDDLWSGNNDDKFRDKKLSKINNRSLDRKLSKGEKWRTWVIDIGDAPEWVEGVVRATAPKTKEISDTVYFDWREAERRVGFIEQYCRYPEGSKSGEKMELDEWQKNDIVRPVFGWKRKDSAINKYGDLRRYRKVFIGIPRKNAKSTLIAAMALSIMMQDGEGGAEIYALASNKEQAGRVYQPIRRFIEMDDGLREMLKVRKDSMTYGKFRSEIKVLAATDGRHGLNTHAVLIDELHEFLQRQQLSALEALTSSMLSRAQPLEFVMTTAGSDVTSHCYAEWEKAVQIQNGSLVSEYADLYLPVIYAADQNDDWHDREVWRKANPGLGTILEETNFKIEYLKAKSDPRNLNTFLRLHLNIWTHADDRWIPDDVWMKRSAKWPDEAVAHLPCYVGMDLASTRDTCAVSFLWVDEKKWRFYLRVKFFVNENQVRDRKINHGVDYLSYVREGSMVVTPGDVTDHLAIKEFISVAASKFRIKTLAYDKYGATTLIPQLVDMGIDCQPFSQGILNMNYPVKQFDVEVAKDNLTHDGSACMRWQMGGVQLKTDNAGNVKIEKNGDRFKVDGPVSAVMAFGQFLHEHARAEQEVVTVVIGLD